ncbi:MAG: S-adenosylmethionine:tRNA ribosyltransferase-isomerase, partial [Bdellovibrionales bacterium]|nr:S-adenosylmethionine:tRNA ribosyltransferase-isomerase [Bdellovibrionales bacterium]
HLSLVSAFFGAEEAKMVYEHALRGSYRFLSYGDSMFLEHAARGPGEEETQ